MIRRLLLAALLVAALPAPGRAQDRVCAFQATGRVTQAEVAGDTIVSIYDPFTVTCNDGAFLQANSGELNRRVRLLHLVGDVFFRDSIQSLTSDEATYSSELARLHATGDVVFTNRSNGSTLEGPELEYFRATDERPLSEVTATRRPTLRLQPEGEEDAEPLNLVADRVLIVGEDDLTATGSVVIDRSDLDATAEEARYNAATEDLELRQNAFIRNESYALRGEVVQARLTEGALEHVHARTDARLTGEDLEVTAPDLQLFFADTLLERAIAKGVPGEVDTRARAASPTFRLDADSLDAVFVDQVLDRVHAIGAARGESIDTMAAAGQGLAVADSAAAGEGPGAQRPEVLAQDWILGDTIIGYFAPAPEPAPAGADARDADDDADPPPVELERLVAIGSAQSLYRMAPQDAVEGDPRRNLNFLVGERIELELAAGELSAAHVQGLQQGVYLEALPASAPGAETDPDGSTDPVPPTNPPSAEEDDA